jgi:hypothetical protein
MIHARKDKLRQEFYDAWDGGFCDWVDNPYEDEIKFKGWAIKVKEHYKSRIPAVVETLKQYDFIREIDVDQNFIHIYFFE